MKKIAARRGHLTADAQDCMLARRSNPQMAIVEQERDAVILGRDRIVGRRRHDLDRLHRQLESAGRALVLAHDAGDFERRFLTHMIGRRETLRAEIGERRNALAYAGAVAHLQEMYLAARALT